MLVHVTMTHTVDDCPGYNPDMMPKILEAGERIEEFSRQFNVKVHYLVSGLPEHVEYALVEADDSVSLANFFAQWPYRVDFKVTAVEHLADVIAKMKAIHGPK